MSFVYLNGIFLPELDAKIRIDNGGWLHGAGLFETMLAQRGQVFRLEKHLERLQRSVQVLLRPVFPDELPPPDVFTELLRRNDLQSARIRLTVTAGSMRPDSEARSQRLDVCLTALPLSEYPTQFYQNGVQAMVSQYRQCPQDPTAGHKTTAYLPRLLGLRQAQQARCFEAFWFTTQNQLAEGSISNVFVVKEGVIRTPALDTPVLPGIARATVLELAKQLQLEAAEEHLSISDLLDAREVFLTNVIMRVMPVIRVEQHDIADGKVGPVTKQIMETYENLIKKECK